MKKLVYLSVVIFCVLAQTISGQNSSFVLGVSGGASLSKFKESGDYLFDGESFKREMRYGGGLDLGVKYNNWTLLTGVNYVQRGGKSEISLQGEGEGWVFWDDPTSVYKGDQIEELTFSFISIPLKIRYERFFGKIGVGVEFGPTFNSISGDIKLDRTYELRDAQDRHSAETYTAGSKGEDYLKSFKVGFTFKPVLFYKVSDQGMFRFGITFDSYGNMINDSYLPSDGNGGYVKLNGELKASAVSVEIGYEYRFDFNLGSKY